MVVSCDIVVASQAGWKSGLEVASEDPLCLQSQLILNRGN